VGNHPVASGTDWRRRYDREPVTPYCLGFPVTRSPGKTVDPGLSAGVAAFERGSNSRVGLRDRLLSYTRALMSTLFRSRPSMTTMASTTPTSPTVHERASA
jgi:hypothetical protein